MYKTQRFYDYPDYAQWMEVVQETNNITIMNITSHKTYMIVTYTEEEKVIG